MKKNKAQCIVSKKTLQNLKERVNSPECNASEKRMRSQSYRVVVKSYVEAVKEFQLAQAGFEKETRSQMGRRLRIVNPNMSDQEVESCIDEGRAQEIFKAVIDQGASGAIANAFRDVSSQHKVSNILSHTPMAEVANDETADFPLILTWN